MCISVATLFISWGYPGELHCGACSQEADNEAEEIKYVLRWCDKY